MKTARSGFPVNNIEPRYKRGVLYSMYCSICCEGEPSPSINEHILHHKLVGGASSISLVIECNQVWKIMSTLLEGKITNMGLLEKQNIITITAERILYYYNQWPTYRVTFRCGCSQTVCWGSAAAVYRWTCPSSAAWMSWRTTTCSSPGRSCQTNAYNEI